MLFKIDKITNRVIDQVKIPIVYTGVDQLCYVDTTTYCEITQKITYQIEINNFKIKELQQGIKSLKQLTPCQIQLQNKFYLFEATQQTGNVYTYDPKSQKLTCIYEIQQIGDNIQGIPYVFDDKTICIIQNGSYYGLKINLEKDTCEQIRLPFVADQNTYIHPLSDNKLLVISEFGIDVYNVSFQTRQTYVRDNFKGCEAYILFQDQQLYITSEQGKLYILDISGISNKLFFEKMKKKNMKINKIDEQQLDFQPIINMSNEQEVYSKELQYQVDQFQKQINVFDNELILLRFCQRLLTINQYKDKSKILYEELFKLQNPGSEINQEIEFQYAGDAYTKELQRYYEKTKQVDQYRKELEKQMNKELKQYKKKKEQEYNEKHNKQEEKKVKEEKQQKQQVQQQKQQVQQVQQKEPVCKKEQPQKSSKQQEMDMFKQIQQQEKERIQQEKEKEKQRREMLEKRKQELYDTSKQQINKKFAIIHTFSLFTQGPAYCTILDERNALIRQGTYLYIFDYLIYRVYCVKTLPYVYKNQPCQYVRKEKRFYEFNGELIYLNIVNIKEQNKLVIDEIQYQKIETNEQQVMTDQSKFKYHIYYLQENSLIFITQNEDKYYLNTLNLNNYNLKIQNLSQEAKVLKDGKQSILLLDNKAYLIDNINDLLSKEVQMKEQYKAKQILHLSKTQIQICDNKLTNENKNIYIALNTIDQCRPALVENIIMFVDDGGLFTTVIVNEQAMTEQQ